ncbi:MAG: hypothetical protein U0350_19995 [Caldilineaceae bacterium]
MAVEPLEKVIQLWERGEITVTQAIGKILLWLRQIETRLRKLETEQRRSGNQEGWLFNSETTTNAENNEYLSANIRCFLHSLLFFKETRAT